MARRSYKFTDKKHTKQGICSAGFAEAALVFTGVSLLLAYRMAGQAGSLVGLLGVLAMVCSAVGFVLAVRGFRKRMCIICFHRLAQWPMAILFILAGPCVHVRHVGKNHEGGSKMELQENIRAGAEEIKERYALVMERIQAMKLEQTVSAPFYAYFQKTADFILRWRPTPKG